MRRCSRQLALFLVLGAVINCALAMGIIWFAPVWEKEMELFTFHGLQGGRIESFGMTMVEWTPVDMQTRPEWEGVPPAWSRVHRLPRPFMSLKEWSNLPVPREHYEYAAGWPLRSVRYEYDLHIRGPRAGEFVIRTGIGLPPRQAVGPRGLDDYHRAIPLRIIPLGFALNTLLFAALAAILWYTPPAIRRIRRMRGNRCLKCGYSREGLADETVCPECGGK